MNDILKCLNPINISKVAGSGNKILYMLDQKADFYINLVPGFKYWDMCASEALVLSMMGVVTNAYKKPIKYNPTKGNFTIREGIIVAKNKKVYDIAVNRIEEGMGRTIGELH